MRRLPKFDSEANLHEMVTQYLRLQYPDVLFRTDMGGVRLSMSQAVAAKRVQHSRAFPDLAVYEPRNGYHGLFLEIKRTGTRLYLKDGVTMVANPHYREQAEVLEKLRERGYAAYFCCGFEEAKKTIDDYLK